MYFNIIISYLFLYVCIHLFVCSHVEALEKAGGSRLDSADAAAAGSGSGGVGFAIADATMDGAGGTD